jgi:hypothetical protein
LKHFRKYLPLLVLLVAGCGTDPKPRASDQGLNYYLIRTGWYQIYDVHEIRYSQVAEPDTLVYEMKTEVVDSFPNATKGITYVIYRSTRDDQSEDWKFLDTWSARVDANQAVQIEGNASYVKLSFPLSLNKTWNGNLLNGIGEDEYKIVQFDEPTTLGGTTFDKTLTVEQEFNDDPIVYTDIRKETYARNIGLIVKETTQLRFCQSESCTGNKVVESGIIFKQQITSYGVR